MAVSIDVKSAQSQSVAASSASTGANRQDGSSSSVPFANLLETVKAAVSSSPDARASKSSSASSENPPLKAFGSQNKATDAVLPATDATTATTNKLLPSEVPGSEENASTKEGLDSSELEDISEWLSMMGLEGLGSAVHSLGESLPEDGQILPQELQRIAVAQADSPELQGELQTLQSMLSGSASSPSGLTAQIEVASGPASKIAEDSTLTSGADLTVDELAALTQMLGGELAKNSVSQAATASSVDQNFTVALNPVTANQVGSDAAINTSVGGQADSLLAQLKASGSDLTSKTAAKLDAQVAKAEPAQASVVGPSTSAASAQLSATAQAVANGNAQLATSQDAAVQDGSRAQSATVQGATANQSSVDSSANTMQVSMRPLTHAEQEALAKDLRANGRQEGSTQLRDGSQVTASQRSDAIALAGAAQQSSDNAGGFGGNSQDDGSNAALGLTAQGVGSSNADKSVANDFKTVMQQASQNANMPSLNGKPDTDAWASQLSRHMQSFTSQGIQSASLRLNPDDLGTLHVRIHIHQDQASVVFQSASPQVRDALEQHMQRLKDGFSEQGLGLGSFDVRDDSGTGQQYGNQNEGGAAGGSFAGDASMSDTGSEVAAATIQQDVSSQLVDYYA
ncbi:flagellar hook-length control protein FliK [Pokkaliibacter sp. CJK22405]|uniref:flagellar hook-length control protein FliK n=1 Tax=Pokkaliibacter sp. CJK22405 TaxID=3384615 RepID=UPI0039852B72